jgi:phosphoribosylformylglycinamidine synthase
MMNVTVLQFPGTNCEYDTKYAFEKLGCNVEIIWHKDTTLPENTDLLVIPGGFSYGDYLRSGAIARFANIMNAVQEYASNGGKVLGIC